MCDKWPPFSTSPAAKRKAIKLDVKLSAYSHLEQGDHITDTGKTYLLCILKRKYKYQDQCIYVLNVSVSK